MKGTLVSPKSLMDQLLTRENLPSEEGDYESYVITQGRETLLLLRDKSLTPFNFGQEVDFWPKEGGVRVRYQGEADDQIFRVVAHRESSYLPALVCPYPVKATHLPEYTLLSYPTAEDRAAATRLCLHLGSTQMQVATFNGHYLLKVEQCPLFLVEEAYSKGLPVYMPMTNHCVIPYGHVHPLEPFWLRDTSLDRGNLYLMGKGGEITCYERPKWESFFDLVKFDLTKLSITDVKRKETSATFNIPVSLDRAYSDYPVDAVLIPEDQAHVIEDFLITATASDVDSLSAAHIKSNNDAYYMIMPVTKAAKSLLRSFAGEALRQFSGISNLYVPQDKSLNPPLRPDQFLKAFTLGPREILVVREEETLRFAQTLAEPLSRMVYHFVMQDQKSFHNAVDHLIFDLGRYRNALTMSGVQQTREAKGLKETRAAKDTAEKASTQKALVKTRRPIKAVFKKPSQEIAQVEEDLVAADLQRQTIIKPSVESFYNLTEHYAHKGSLMEALMLAFEVLWYDEKEDQDSWPSLEAMFSSAITTLQKDKKHTKLSQALVFYAALRSYGDHGQGSLDSLITQYSGFKNSFKDLPLRVAYVILRKAVSIFEDERTKASLRDQLVEKLNTQSVSLSDIPPSIVGRLRMEPSLFSGEVGETQDFSQQRETLRYYLDLLRSTDPTRDYQIQAALVSGLARVGDLEAHSMVLQDLTEYVVGVRYSILQLSDFIAKLEESWPQMEPGKFVVVAQLISLQSHLRGITSSVHNPNIASYESLLKAAKSQCADHDYQDISKLVSYLSGQTESLGGSREFFSSKVHTSQIQKYFKDLEDAIVALRVDNALTLLTDGIAIFGPAQIEARASFLLELGKVARKAQFLTDTRLHYALGTFLDDAMDKLFSEESANLNPTYRLTSELSCYAALDRLGLKESSAKALDTILKQKNARGEEGRFLFDIQSLDFTDTFTELFLPTLTTQSVSVRAAQLMKFADAILNSIREGYSYKVGGSYSFAQWTSLAFMSNVIKTLMSDAGFQEKQLRAFAENTEIAVREALAAL